MTGCERLLSLRDPIPGDGSDSGDLIDGGLSSGSPLLLSEVVLTPNAGEMIEIVNTSADDVDLATYYLSDSGNYYRLPVSATVDVNDFIVKFRVGARIKGHEALTIAIDTPANFATQYSKSPSFSLMDDTLDKIAMNGTPQLTNTGEPIILFQWDGRSDLVRDVDIMIVGAPTAANPLPDKSGMSQDGPDAGNLPSTYATEAHALKPQAATPGAGVSTKRIALENVGNEHTGSGNGQSGDDETSEDTSLTWDGTAALPFSAPTPGDVPPALLR
ncbi:MAG: lamin tail domain-containing protein [Deltaproteobacteria bacterium]|nr:MAG: lamin tail domain-containing protein [Deltaproteobacteria bacterium]